MSTKSARGKDKSNKIWINLSMGLIILASIVIFAAWPRDTLGKNFPEVVKYYPELVDKSVVSHGTVTTETTTTTWFNFANDATVNPTALKEYFRYFEQLSRAGITIPYAIDKRPMTLTIQRPIRTNRVFIFISNNDPKPAWSTSDAQAATSAQSDGYYVVFIRVIHNDTLPKSSLFTTPQAFLTKMVAVETCQSSIGVRPDNDADILIAQEVTCNSFGDAFATKQRGVVSSDYFERMHWITYFGQVPIALDESSYQAMPYVGDGITLINK